MKNHHLCVLALLSATSPAFAAKPAPNLPFPPTLPGGAEVVSHTSDEFLKKPATIKPDVEVAKTVPKVDFMFYPGQSYPGNPWSNWGDSLAVGGKYYASIGDHLAPAGNAFVYEYDPGTQKLRQLADVGKVLALPAGHYV